MKRIGFQEIFVTICLVFLVIVILKRNKENDRISENAGYSIGTVTKYLSERGGYTGSRLFKSRRSGYLDYFFLYKGEKYCARLSGTIRKFPSKGEFVGKDFMVIFNKNNPKESLLLFDMPVSDSTDFKRYVFELATENRKK